MLLDSPHPLASSLILMQQNHSRGQQSTLLRKLTQKQLEMLPLLCYQLLHNSLCLSFD